MILRGVKTAKSLSSWLRKRRKRRKRKKRRSIRNIRNIGKRGMGPERMIKSENGGMDGWMIGFWWVFTIYIHSI